MIYSASRRTDMAAFFPEIIADKVERSRRLEGIVFWTKDIRNLVSHPRLSGIVARVPSVVQYTVTGLAGTSWEPGVPPLSEQLGELGRLAEVLPVGAVRWRFDPILPGPDVIERFRSVKKGLESVLGVLDEVTVSFPDPYRQAVARVAASGLDWPIVGHGEKVRILSLMAREFPGAERPVRLCCEPDLLALPGIGMARCIDGGLFERLYGVPLGGLGKDLGQRKACGCSASTDIGSYDMRCRHGCRYCYANPSV